MPVPRSRLPIYQPWYLCNDHDKDQDFNFLFYFGFFAVRELTRDSLPWRYVTQRGILLSSFRIIVISIQNEEGKAEKRNHFTNQVLVYYKIIKTYNISALLQSHSHVGKLNTGCKLKYRKGVTIT